MNDAGNCPVCNRTLHLDVDGEDYTTCLSGCYYAVGATRGIGFPIYARVGTNKPLRDLDESSEKQKLFNEQVKELQNIYRKNYAPVEAAMLEALRTNPYDQFTRNAYYDWLQEQGIDDRAYEVISWTEERIKAKEDLIIFGIEIEQSYDRLIEIGHTLVEDPNEDIYFNSTEASYAFSSSETRNRFWDMWSKVTGVSVDRATRNSNNFSCSC